MVKKCNQRAKHVQGFGYESTVTKRVLYVAALLVIREEQLTIVIAQGDIIFSLLIFQSAIILH